MSLLHDLKAVNGLFERWRQTGTTTYLRTLDAVIVCPNLPSAKRLPRGYSYAQLDRLERERPQALLLDNHAVLDLTERAIDHIMTARADRQRMEKELAIERDALRNTKFNLFAAYSTNRAQEHRIRQLHGVIARHEARGRRLRGGLRVVSCLVLAVNVVGLGLYRLGLLYEPGTYSPTLGVGTLGLAAFFYAVLLGLRAPSEPNPPL